MQSLQTGQYTPTWHRLLSIGNYPVLDDGYNYTVAEIVEIFGRPKLYRNPAEMLEEESAMARSLQAKAGIESSGECVHCLG